MRAPVSRSRSLHNPHFPGEAFAFESGGPDAVLLFHGFTATPYEVYGLGQALQKAGYSAYGPMLAGHGTHPRDLNQVRWQTWTEEAEQTFDALAQKYRRVIVGGESNGGLIALHLAAARPEAAAVLAYAPAFKIHFSPFQRLLLKVLTPLGFMQPKPDIRANTDWQGYRYNPLRGLAQLLELQAAVRAVLPRVCQPALIAQGREDYTIAPEGAEELYALLGSQNKELHWYDQGPHCLLLSAQREQVYNLSVEFLGRVGIRE